MWDLHNPSHYHSSSYCHEVRLLQESNKHSNNLLICTLPFLRRLKEIAERHRGIAVTTAFITVPAFFPSPNISLDKAAKAVGFAEFAFVQETMAAAIAYVFNNKIVSPQSLMVFSLGGGFLETAFFSEVSTTKFSPSPGCLVADAFDCGLKEFKQCMIQFLARRCREETGHDLLSKLEMRLTVRLEAEKLNECLQTFNTTAFKFECISHDCDCLREIRATEFNRATKPLVDTIRKRLEMFKAA